MTDKEKEATCRICNLATVMKVCLKCPFYQAGINTQNTQTEDKKDVMK